MYYLCIQHTQLMKVNDYNLITSVLNKARFRSSKEIDNQCWQQGGSAEFFFETTPPPSLVSFRPHSLFCPPDGKEEKPGSIQKASFTS